MGKGRSIGMGAAIAGGLAIGAGLGLYATRMETMASIHQLSWSGTPYDLYAMDVRYAYDLDRIIARGLAGDQANMDALIREALPLLPVHMRSPEWGCSAFALSHNDDVLMGRNYDFRFDTSCLMVRSTPKNGYASVAFCALDNLGANSPLGGLKGRLACLAAPFVCLDGINERGVSISVLTLDSEPTRQRTGKPAISTSLVTRLVLDRAATTQEAIDLLLSYDMFAVCGRDYHFYISDATGDGRVLEYDCQNPERPAVVTPVPQVTNFFAMYADRVQSNQKNGIYGHGRERADAIARVLDGAAASEGSQEVAWRALRVAAQKPNPADITSNTQWSIVFDNKACTADIALRRRWDDVHHFAVK